MAGSGWANVLHPHDAERTIARWKDCVRNEGKWDIEHRDSGEKSVQTMQLRLVQCLLPGGELAFSNSAFAPWPEIHVNEAHGCGGVDACCWIICFRCSNIRCMSVIISCVLLP